MFIPRRKGLRYRWFETFSGYGIADTVSGEEVIIGDGVNMLYDARTDKAISPGTKKFNRAMNIWVRSSQSEIGEAYFDN